MDVANPEQSLQLRLSNISAEAAADLVAAGSDLALMIDKSGIVLDIAVSDDSLLQEVSEEWRGRPWTDTVTVESRAKIAELLDDAEIEDGPHRRQVNHPSPLGRDLPVLYSTLSVGDDGDILALGRDLRAISDLQQSLLSAQQSLQKDYGRLRQAETRYRMLFHVSSEAVMIVDERSQRIVEANPSAAALLEKEPEQVSGQRFPDGFSRKADRVINKLLDSVRVTGRAKSATVQLGKDSGEFQISASLFRQDNDVFFLVRLVSYALAARDANDPERRSTVLEVVEKSPEGFVVTTSDAQIITANDAFLEMAQLVKEEQARGERLDRWLGRGSVDLNVLIANLRQSGSVKLFATTIAGDYGLSADVEVSAVSVPDSDPPCLGFMIRNVERRLTGPRKAESGLPGTVEQLTEQVGRVSLKEIVRDATDAIERLCIETALELTGDNRASAAEILGLSRQSLYVKLRRHGLGDLEPEGDA
ncbi:MAG: transcriptional regulator PpsR [Alphaproteobacteria bacterium]